MELHFNMIGVASCYTHATSAFMILVLLSAGLIWRVIRVRRLRYQRIKECLKRYAYLEDKPALMTYNIANDILKVSHYWDFPWSLITSDSLALFKTYAIPSISETLAISGQLSDPLNATRRAEDTGIFVVEFISQGLDSERGSVLLARINWLHDRWKKHIKQEDLLFTLSLFIFEPIDFLQKYEWRELCELEKQALFLFWAEIGARMGIENIPSTMQELWNWKEQYASETMVPSETGANVAALTMDVLVASLPGFLKPLGREAGKVFVEPRVMEAFGWKRAPAIFYWLVPALLRIRACILRNLTFPRTKKSKFMTHNEVQVASPDGKLETRIQREGFLWEPWYVPAGKSRVGKLGINVPGDKAKWQSDGYKCEALGPDALKNQGIDAVLMESKRIREAGIVCPFFRP
ncbi:hypothetical protein P389DRAFT_210898 [Cystobasidium minutum MCA 4210]|uniref:uncharacterized protein n=1 Tax=Cystobasidium minutum MCA 4210 TaxID=1397322 RepID=UPI0034CE564B|eukprot:jgi/Rhomi1/210898/estExt_Genemark1.C_4_t10490